MSLKAKIALGVLAATAMLGAALAVLGIQARNRLEEAARVQQHEAQQRLEAFTEEQRQLLVRSIETLVLAQLEPLLLFPVSEIAEELRRPNNGLSEAAILTIEGDEIAPQVLKPADSQASLTAEEEAVAREVFRTGRFQFLGDLLFHPYRPQEARPESPPVVLRLKLDIPEVRRVELPPPPSADLGPLALAAFTTLGLAMLAVFILLLFALRRFVLAPLGNVLEDSKRIVKGAEGLEVRGFTGGGNDIETLVAAFNAMFHELKAYQADLEGRVREATRTIQQQQQSLVIAQRLAATGTLAAGLAHEVNNPLSGMLNAARRLRKREGLDERARDYIGLIEEGLERIEQLMKQILDFSRRRDSKPERFTPEQVLRNALPLVRHRLEKKRIRMEEDVAPDLPPLYGNPEEISQVLMNLLINATDAAPEGGAVRVSIRPGAEGGVRVTVEDSGDGVPEDIRERIFDPFFTTKEPGKGTGLGLAIAHTVVDNHGGSLRVEKGAVLGGACFVLELPPAAARETRRAKRERAFSEREAGGDSP
jgi:signal transduction histidine kinase